MELAFDDLRSLPAEFQVADASRFAAGARGQAVRLAGVLAHVGAKPHPLYLNAGSREGARRLALSRREVAQLALIVYAIEGRPLTAADGGPFRLVLPGFHDGARDVQDLGWIEVALRAGPDDRAQHAEREQLVIGNQSFDAELAWKVAVAPDKAETFVIPPPNG